MERGFLVSLIWRVHYWRFHFCSWLYHSDATVSHVEAAAEEGSCNADALRVWVVFSEPTLAKFLSKFSGDDVTMTPCEDHNFTMKHTH